MLQKFELVSAIFHFFCSVCVSGWGAQNLNVMYTTIYSYYLFILSCHSLISVSYSTVIYSYLSFFLFFFLLKVHSTSFSEVYKTSKTQLWVRCGKEHLIQLHCYTSLVTSYYQRLVFLPQSTSDISLHLCVFLLLLFLISCVRLACFTKYEVC